WRRDLPARDESWHPTAPVRRNAACASCAGDTAFALAGGAKVRPLSSSAAGSRRPLAVRLLPPSVPPPASARSPHNACLPERAPLGETPRGELGWRLARSCHAAALSHPHRDSAPTPAWLADSSAPATPPPLAAQAARLYPPHDLDTTQLFAAQSTSPQSECLLSKAL